MNKISIKNNTICNNWVEENAQETTQNNRFIEFCHTKWRLAELNVRLHEIVIEKKANKDMCTYLFKEIDIPRTTLMRFLKWTTVTDWTTCPKSIEDKYIEKIEQFVIKNDAEIKKGDNLYAKVDFEQVYEPIASDLISFAEALEALIGQYEITQNFDHTRHEKTCTWKTP